MFNAETSNTPQGDVRVEGVMKEPGCARVSRTLEIGIRRGRIVCGCLEDSLRVPGRESLQLEGEGGGRSGACLLRRIRAGRLAPAGRSLVKDVNRRDRKSCLL